MRGLERCVLKGSEEGFVKVWGARLSELGAWLRAESEHSAC